MSCKSIDARIKKFSEFAKEERESANEYRRLGFKSIAKDELRHSRFFKRKVEELKKKRSMMKKNKTMKKRGY